MLNIFVIDGFSFSFLCKGNNAKPKSKLKVIDYLNWRLVFAHFVSLRAGIGNNQYRLLNWLHKTETGQLIFVKQTLKKYNKIFKENESRLILQHKELIVI